MPEPGVKVERRRLARQAARRAEAVRCLQIAECTARYGASVLGDGAGPAEAAEAAREVACELAAVSEMLLRLSRPGSPADRRLLVQGLDGLGYPRRRMAAAAGVSERTVARYLNGG